MLLAVFLIGWPQTINSILVDAGFEEGSFAGMKWKAKLTRTDDSLVVANETIANLEEQNNKMDNMLTEIKVITEDPSIIEKI